MAADAGRLAAALGQAPLFAGMAEEDLRDFASVFRMVELEAGEALFRQATPVDGLHVLLSGEARVTRRLPGEREVEIARLGPGAVMGEIPLLGSGTRSATVQADSPCSLAFLRREDFHARMRLGRPSALLLRRRIVEMACARIRADHASLAASIDGGAAHPRAAAATPGPVPPEPEVAKPSAVYAARLPFFRSLGPDLAAALLDRGEIVQFAPRTVILEEGEMASHLHITLNGAVEDVLRRGPQSLRVRFAGPGRAFGYLGLLDGRPATASSVARERSVALAVEAREFGALLRDADDFSRSFAAAVESDLMEMLRSTAAPKAQLATAGAR